MTSAMQPTGMAPLQQLATGWAVRLTTFRKDGTPVGTAVNIVRDGDRVYFRTYEQAGKFKRLRRNPHVEVAPSTARGKATGPAVRATVQILHGAEDRRAGELIDRKHRIFQGLLVRTAHRLKGYTTRHFELLPEREPGAQ